MKITDNNRRVILTLETPEGANAFKQGITDRRYWFKSPETIEMATYINDNRSSAQISVQVGDSYQLVR